MSDDLTVTITAEFTNGVAKFEVDIEEDQIADLLRRAKEARSLPREEQEANALEIGNVFDNATREKLAAAGIKLLSFAEAE